MTRIQQVIGWERRFVATLAMSLSVLAMPYPYRGAQQDLLRIRDEAAHYCENVRMAYKIAVVVQETAEGTR